MLNITNIGKAQPFHSVSWKECYHRDVPSGESSFLGLAAIHNSCEDVYINDPKMTNHHASGWILNLAGKYIYVPGLRKHEPNDPNCIIDTVIVNEPNF